MIRLDWPVAPEARRCGRADVRVKCIILCVIIAHVVVIVIMSRPAPGQAIARASGE